MAEKKETFMAFERNKYRRNKYLSASSKDILVFSLVKHKDWKQRETANAVKKAQITRTSYQSVSNGEQEDFL